MVCAGITLGAEYIEVAYNAADGTHGASELDPYDLLQDIYDTDVANGWGFFTLNGSSGHCNGRGIRIQGTTYARLGGISSVMLEISNAPATYGFYSSTSGKLSLQSSTIKINNNNKYLYISGQAEGLYYNVLQAYRMHIYTGVWNNLNIYRAQIIYVNGTPTFNNLTLINCDNGLTPYNGNAIYNGLIFINCDYGIYTYVLDGTLKITGLKVIGTSGIKFRMWKESTLQLLDSMIDPENYGILTNDEGTDVAEFYTTVNVHITNGTGGTLTIYDKDDNVVYTEVLAGEDMTEQELMWAKRTITASGGVAVVNELVYYHPYRIVVTKPGYQDLEIPGIEVRRGEKTDVHGKMVTSPAPIYYDTEITAVVEQQQELSGSVEVIELEATVD
jgi:hypothetical protein